VLSPALPPLHPRRSLPHPPDRDETLDPERCAVMLAGVQSVDETVYASAQDGLAVAAPDDAGSQTRLLGSLGRDPRDQARRPRQAGS
jgi:hypothetical protein